MAIGPLRRISLFLIVLTIGVVGFVAVALASPTFVTPSRSGGMMGAGGMMSWWMPFSGSQYSYPSLMWLLPVATLALILVGVAGVIYGVAVPEIRTVGTAPSTIQPSDATPPPSPAPKPTEAVATTPSEGNMEAVFKASRPDERKVLDVLRAHDGRYLQKWIVRETGMSRLQVHRAVARLAERNMVEVRVVGNTNEVSLARWLTTDITK
jgi:hypothetical protein